MLESVERLAARRGRWDGGAVEVTVDLPADPDALTDAPAPLILHAVAVGDLQGEADEQEIGRTRLVPRSGGAPDRT